MSKLGYTWYPRDFASDPDVMLMTAAERGIYRDLIDLAYQTDNYIKYSIEALSRYTNGDIKDIKHVLDTKGENMGEYWRIPSCDKRIAIIKKNQSNGSKNKGKADPKGIPYANPNDTPDATQTDSKTGKQREREREREVKKEIIKIEKQTEVLAFFDFSESYYHTQQVLVNDFFYAKHQSGELDHFLQQFEAYKRYSALTDHKYKFSMYNFLGDQSERFASGKWNAENWLAKISEPTVRKLRTVNH